MEITQIIDGIASRGFWFNLTYWSTAIAVFYLGLIVYLRDKKSSTNRAFVIFSFSLIPWAIVTPLYLLSGSALILHRFVNAWAFLMTGSYLRLCLAFPKRKDYMGKWEKIGVIASACFALVALFTPLVVIRTKVYDWGTNGEQGPLNILLVIWILIYCIISITSVIKKLKLSKGKARAQIQYFLLGLSLFVLYVLPTNLIYPQITGKVDLDIYGPFGSIFFVGFIFLAIVRHRLLDIRLIALKSVVYTTLVGLITASYLIVIFYLKKHYEQAINLDIVFVLAILVAAFGFQPLRRLLQKYADRLFSKGRYNFEELLKKISNVLSTNLVIDNLSEQLLSTLSNAMKIRKSAFVLQEGYHKSYLDSSSQAPQNDNSNRKEIQSLFSIAQFNSALVADELEDDDSKKILMRKLGIEVIIYFADEGKAIGFLTLSEKASGDAYSAQDLKLLEIIAPQITIALKNIEQQQQMIEQIVEERQRINQDAHDHIYNRLGALAKKAEIAELNPQGAGETLALLKTDLRIAVDDLQRIVKGETQEEDHDNAFIIEELKKICSDFETQSSIKLDLNCACDILNNLPPKDLWHLQCILEECLNNVRKHSQATQVNVEISKNNGSIIMQVKDNGVGMKQFTNDNLRMPNEKPIENSKSKIENSRMGLKGMQGRAKKINGEITFTSNNGRGTKVELRVPC